MDDGRRLSDSPHPSRPPRSRARTVLLLGGASVVLMLAAATPAADASAVFPSYYSIELLSPLLLGCLYLSSLLFAGLRWTHLVIDVPGRGPRHDRTLAATGAVVCVIALLLVPVDGLRIVGGPPTDLLDPAAWHPGVTSDAWASLAMTWAGVVAVALTRFAERWMGRWLWRPVALAAPLLVVLSPTWLGHSRSESPRALMVTADAVHLVAGAWWMSGVVVLAALLLAGPRRGVLAREVTEALARFSAGARITAAAVAVSGLGMATLILDRPGDIVTTGWGRALMIKVFLVVVVMALARWNEIALTSRVDQGRHEAECWSIMRATMISEAALLTTVVVLTGFVTQMSPG